MRVLLIATNQADRYMDRMSVQPLPVGLAYVAAHLDTTRHHLQILDCMFADDAVAATLNLVQHFQPEVIGLSIRNLDNQSYLNSVWYLPAVRELIRHLRSASQAQIVCGGPAFSILPEACFDYLRPDLGLAGDAAESFAQLVDCLERGVSSLDVPGLVTRDGNRIVVQEGHCAAAFHTPPRLDLLDLRRYDKAGFGIGVVTKLAPYYYPTSPGAAHDGGSGWRIRPVEEVVEELGRLQRDFGIRKVFFIDSGFNVPLSQAKALCQALLQSGLTFRWNSYLRVGEGDAELIDLMRRSGCALALLNTPFGGGEAAADLQTSLQQTQRLTTLCAQGDLPFTVSLTFGSVGETATTVEQKLTWLRDTQPAFATLRVGARVLPSTPLAKVAREEGRINSEADLIKPTFYLSAAVQDWLVDHLHTAAAMQPRWHLM
jgi:B12 binding domain